MNEKSGNIKPASLNGMAAISQHEGMFEKLVNWCLFVHRKWKVMDVYEHRWDHRIKRGQ